MGNNGSHNTLEKKQKRPLRSIVFVVTVFPKVLQFGYEIFPRSLRVEHLVARWGTILGGSETWKGADRTSNSCFEGNIWSPVPSSFICFLSTMRATAFYIFSHCHDLLLEYMGPRRNGPNPLNPLNCSPSIWVTATANILIISKIFHYRGWTDASVARSIYQSCKGPASGSQYSCQADYNHL